MANLRIAIVGAEFHSEITDSMVQSAQIEAQNAGLTVVESVRVPGSYEMPIVTNLLLSKSKIDAVVVLGCIERGETLHGEVMGHVVHQALIDLQLKYGKPVGLGIIGPGATAEHMEVRKDGYARAAVKAALRVHAVISEIERRN